MKKDNTTKVAVITGVFTIIATIIVTFWPRATHDNMPSAINQSYHTENQDNKGSINVTDAKGGVIINYNSVGSSSSHNGREVDNISSEKTMSQPNELMGKRSESLNPSNQNQKRIQIKDEPQRALAESLDKKLSSFLEKYSDIDLNEECQNKSEYMKKYREASALLDIIEIEANRLGRKDIIAKFVFPRRDGIHIVSYNCP